MKTLVNILLEKAQERIRSRKTPPKLDEQQARIQMGFDSIPSLQQNDMMADYTRLLTGFRPLLRKPTGRPFDIWVYQSGKVATPHVGMVINGNQVWGCSNLDNTPIYYDSNCRPATDEEATAFLKVIETWDDAGMLRWVAEKVGGQHVGPFLGLLES